MTKPKAKHYSRQAVRYHPQESTIAQLDLLGAHEEYLGTYRGLVFSEASRGCGLVLLSPIPLKVGQSIRIQVGPLDPLAGRICWISEVDTDLIKVGIEYLLK